MISLYTGVPGSGKSYHCTKDIVSYIKSGKNVISNYPVSLDHCEGYGNFILIEDEKDLTIPFLYTYAKLNHVKGKEGQTLVVIDEAQLKFNSRTWKDKDRLDWCSFFTVHRHLGFNFILATQQLDFIDKQIRGLCEYNYEHRNLKKTKLNNIFPFMPTLFLIIQKWAINEMKITTDYSLYDKKVGSCYDSYVFYDKLLANIQLPPPSLSRWQLDTLGFSENQKISN